LRTRGLYPPWAETAPTAQILFYTISKTAFSQRKICAKLIIWQIVSQEKQAGFGKTPRKC